MFRSGVVATIPRSFVVAQMASAPAYWHPSRRVSYEFWHNGRKIIYWFTCPEYSEIDNKVRETPYLELQDSNMLTDRVESDMRGSSRCLLGVASDDCLVRLLRTLPRLVASRGRLFRRLPSSRPLSILSLDSHEDPQGDTAEVVSPTVSEWSSTELEPSSSPSPESAPVQGPVPLMEVSILEYLGS